MAKLSVLGFGLFLFMASGAQAASRGAGGGMAIGLLGGIVNSSQESMNTLITRANLRVGGISTSQMDSAYELGAFFMYRFAGTMYALQLRPSYFYQVQSGTGTGGDFNYGLKGFTIFPMFRLYPMENNYMKFYMQVGMGYGRVSGEISEAGSVAQFNGSGFGTMAGLGAEFCVTPSNCFSFEGNYRYLTFDRSLVSGSSGGFASGSLSQAVAGQELELDGMDVSTRMGGLQFMFGYTSWF